MTKNEDINFQTNKNNPTKDNIVKCEETKEQMEEKKSDKIKNILTGLGFEELVTQSDIFVDKTEFINELIKRQAKVPLITMPRRSSKSHKIEMLYKFFSITVDEDGNVIENTKTNNYKLFVGGKIGNKNISKSKLAQNFPNIIEEHQGKYPVIHLDFSDCKMENFNKMRNVIVRIIFEVFKKFDYLENSKILKKKEKEEFSEYYSKLKSREIEDDQLTKSIKVLSQLLEKHHNQKVWILIDEYDTPLNEAFKDFGKKEYDDRNQEFKSDGVFKKLNRLLAGIMSEALKGNESLYKALITGYLEFLKIICYLD